VTAKAGQARKLPVQSAAVVVETTEDHDLEPPYNDLRIDATETPIADLRETYELAQRGYRDTLAQYEGRSKRIRWRRLRTDFSQMSVVRLRALRAVTAVSRSQ